MVKRKVKSECWIIPGATLLMLLLLMTGCAAQKSGSALDSDQAVAKVIGVQVDNQKNQDLVTIATEPESVKYSVYKWADPERIVVDLENAVSDQVPSTIPVADGFIQEVEVKGIQAGDKDSESLVRVIINLENELDYEVDRQQGTLVVSLNKTGEKARSSGLFPSESSLVMVEENADSPEWAWSGPAAAPSSDAAPLASASRLEKITVDNEDDLTRVNLILDGAVGDYSAFTLDNPGRIVVDLWGIKDGYKVERKDINRQGISKVRTGQHDDKMRLVFDAKGDLPNFRFDKQNTSLVVTLSQTLDVSAAPEVSLVAATETAGASDESGQDWPVMEVAQAEEWSGPESGSTAAGEAPVEWSSPIPVESAPGTGEAFPIEGTPTEAAPMETAPAVPASPTLDWGPAVVAPEKEGATGIAYIDSVKFDYSNDSSSIVIHADRPIRREIWTREDNPEEKIITFFIKSAQVAADQQRSYDTTEFQSPIELFSVFQRPNVPNEVAIVIVMRNWAASKWSQPGNKLTVQFENYPGSLGLGGGPTEGMFGPRGEEYTGGMPGMGGEPTAMVAPGEPGVQYSGPPINLDFKNMDILDVLRTIAEISGMNMVVDDEVRGKVTLKLDNVPWDQALDIILETKELGKVEKGNIIRIARRESIQKEQAERAAEEDARKKIEDLQTRIIPINYLKAQDLLRIIQPILTQGRGKATTDKRTNSLIVTDIASTIQEIYKMVSSLDRPTKQVLIEARIVEATVGVTRVMGVSWGTNANIGPATGTPTGVNFPNTIQVGGATFGGANNAPNLTGAESAAGGGAIGMSVGSLSGVVDLDMMLRALESQQKIKIISSPRVLTLTDETAKIEQGISIAYPPPSITSGAGAVGWTFVEASLQLQVTPHVAADNSIVMEVKASNNEPTTVVGSDQPSISKKEAQTTILLNNGETAVIGGIFKISKNTPVSKVPFLGNLPVVGALFTQTQTDSRNEELIIFITPQIIEPGKGGGEPIATGSGFDSGM